MGRAGLEHSIEKFRDFCFVDRQLSRGRVGGHLKNIRRFLRFVDGREVTVEVIRDYLAVRREMVKSRTYADDLCSLKVFVRDFMGRPDLVSSFRFPPKTYPLKQLPSKDVLQKFFGLLESDRDRALFLIFASSGLRFSEVTGLRKQDVNFDLRRLIPQSHETERTKKSWISFYNDEAEYWLGKYLSSRVDGKDKLFPVNDVNVWQAFRRASEKLGVKVTPQTLRAWFCTEMAMLGIPDRYIDAFCGRVPRSVLARHYTDFSPERLKEIYEKTPIQVLS